MTETLNVRSPQDLIAAVPYLLGFAPQSSLVVAGMSQGQLVVTVRVDLADVTGEPALLAQALDSLIRANVDVVIGVIYSSACAPEMCSVLPESGAAQLFGSLAAERDLEVAETLLVCDGRWWSYSCSEPQCCPPQGKRLATDTVIAAECTLLGLAPLPTRDALGESIKAGPHQEWMTAPLAAAEARQSTGLSMKRAVFAAARLPESELTIEQVAEFGVALRNIPIRDALWLSIDAKRIDGAWLWAQLARRLPVPYDAAPLFLAGWQAWRAGNGPLASMAVERILTSDPSPSYSAAQLLLTVLRRGIDPGKMPKLHARKN